jgi:hypothetical protein
MMMMFAAVLAFLSADSELKVVETKKISQITGETDREKGVPSDSRTESRFGLYGTDLGTSFEHNGRLVFLFGDTWSVGGKYTDERPVDSDAIAFSTDKDPENGLTLDFLTGDDGKYLPVQIPGVSLKGFEVPNGGYSHNGFMYGFYTTDATWLPKEFFMGRSVLARSRDGRAWELVRTISTDKFVNVSPWVVDASKVAGLPVKKGKGLLMFASGKKYRRSDPFLAYSPIDKMDDPGAMRFWSKEGKWSANEAEAAPLFQHAEIGEISVAWCEPLRRWIMMYNSGKPRGIHLRWAKSPIGPWSEPIVAFDPENGYGKFMHVSWKDRKADSVHDPWRPDEYGGEYGPYMIPKFFKKTPKGAILYYVMSTWNPYNVVLMRTDLEWAEG